MPTEHIIVTGDSGFLGRYAAVRLCNAGYDVLGVSRHAASIKATGGSYMQAQLNLEDGSCIDELTRWAGGRVKAIVHFAAALPVTFGTSDSEECSRRNFLIDDHIIRVCERLACSLVYGSTASVYSMRSPDLNAEGSPTDTRDPYAAEKLAMEKEALSRAPLFTGLRITAPYGPCQRTRTVVRIFLEQALQNRSLLIHGGGNREQDFIHAADVAEAVLCSIERPVSGVFNIGCGAPVTMKKLAEITTRSVLGCTSQVRMSGLNDPQEPRYARISITKAWSQLRWSPKVTLDQGIYQWAELLRNEAQHANCAPI